MRSSHYSPSAEEQKKLISSAQRAYLSLLSLS
uniref:Uncharacterized protein n=1 Tax=Anguilla anguilla TaxID=7936 RepID=A0A0E9S0M6_ANGAN